MSASSVRNTCVFIPSRKCRVHKSCTIMYDCIRAAQLCSGQQIIEPSTNQPKKKSDTVDWTHSNIIDRCCWLHGCSRACPYYVYRINILKPARHVWPEHRTPTTIKQSREARAPPACAKCATAAAWSCVSNGGCVIVVFDCDSMHMVRHCIFAHFV